MRQLMKKWEGTRQEKQNDSDKISERKGTTLSKALARVYTD